MLGLDDENIFSGLEPAGDLEEQFLGDDEAELFKKLGRDDGIADAGFVFEADEDESLGGAGALTANDISSNGDDLPFTTFRDVRGAPDIRELLAKQGHWMRAGGEVHAFIVGT